MIKHDSQMKKILVFDTSYGSFNMGDFIINESASKQLSFIFDDNFVIRMGTHNPIAHNYQLLKTREIVSFMDNVDYKFLIGTNILKKNMFKPWSDWNVNVFNCRPYKGVVLVGVGSTGEISKANSYTRKLYKKMLNKNFVHSTRDEKTKKFLESLGFQAINTGCATMWNLTGGFCKGIKKDKSDSVIFTLTDYNRDVTNDQLLIDILNKNYKNVYFWIQGSNDFEYIKSLKNIEKIKFINPELRFYREFLENNDVDYVGTRLHAGIYALQHKKRSIILAVDNRTNDMKETYNLPSMERREISDKLEDLINSTFETKINIDENAIAKWKGQFKDV